MTEGQDKTKIMVPLFAPDRRTIEGQGATNPITPVKTIEQLYLPGSRNPFTGNVIEETASFSIMYDREETANGLICYVRQEIEKEKDNALLAGPFRTLIIGEFGTFSLEVRAAGTTKNELSELMQGLKDTVNDAITRDARFLADIEIEERFALEEIADPGVGSMSSVAMAEKALEERKRQLEGKPDPTSEHSSAYWEGIVEGLWSYAVWKDGVQYVGSTGKTLGQAYDNAGVPEEFRR